MADGALGIDLRLRQVLHALPYTAEPQFERGGRLALADHGVAQPERGWDERERDQNDDEPGELLRQRLGAEGLE